MRTHAADYTTCMQPVVDQAIIATMQRGTGNAVLRVVLLVLFALMMGAGFTHRTALFAWSALAFAVLLVGVLAFTNRRPRCSLCGGTLSAFSRQYSREEYRSLLAAPGAPGHLRAVAAIAPTSPTHRMIAGYECYHCRKMAILG